jgi:replicative DNA helicase
VDKNFAGIMVSQINRGSEMTENKRPNLWQLKSSGCILGDSLVMGKRIEDIYKNQDFFPIKTLDTDTGEVKNIIPNRIVNTGKLDCWRIKTKSGKEIILSKGTKLFSDNEWKTVDKLKISDTIVVEHSDITKEDL